MVRRKKLSLRPFFWAITFVLTATLSSSLFAIFNNQGAVANWIYLAGGGALLVLMVMIFVGTFTTNETLAFRRK